MAVSSMASCTNPTGSLEKNSLLRCDGVSSKRVAEEESVAIVRISKEGVYIVVTVVVSLVVAVALVVATVLVATGLELRLIAAVVLVNDTLNSMVLLGAVPMSLIDVNFMLVIGGRL